jgi:ATP-dependent DNA helicase RecQ
MLLHYFGEEYHLSDCGSCDNCRFPKSQFDGEHYLVTLFNAILEIQEKFKSEHVANFLAGNEDGSIKTYKHHKLELFGSGSEKDARFWNMIIRQALVNDLLQKEIENYGLLKLTKKGHAFLDEPYSIMLVQDIEYGEDDEYGEINLAGKSNTVDDELFEILKDLRKKISKQKKLPPFVIFQDSSLEDMCIQYPITMAEMQNISGVGAGKAQRYGKEFIDIIQTYVEEKEIIRPQDMVVRSVVNKSGLKVYIIQAIDRQVDFADICESKNIDLHDLLNEIEAIVNSGTKLNLDYYINQILDDDRCEEIYQYFKDAETESIEDALDILGEDDYSEEEIRLIRVKFISELGN